MQPQEENGYSGDEHEYTQQSQQRIQNQSQQTAGVVGRTLALSKLWKSQLDNFNDDEEPADHGPRNQQGVGSASAAFRRKVRSMGREGWSHNWLRTPLACWIAIKISFRISSRLKSVPPSFR